MSWAYDGHDIGLRLFTEALKAGAPMTVTPGMRVLEVGCCEADWLGLAHTAWPDVTLIGIDTQATDDADSTGTVTRMRADVLNPGLFAPMSLDAVVSISTIEHVGLGHYGDPVAAIGDSRALWNIRTWLKPGGWLYFDVPYSSDEYRVLGTEYRVYDEPAVTTRLCRGLGVTGQRLWVDRWRGYADCHGTVMPDPIAWDTRRVECYAAMVWTKE